MFGFPSDALRIRARCARPVSGSVLGAGGVLCPEEVEDPTGQARNGPARPGCRGRRARAYPARLPRARRMDPDGSHATRSPEEPVTVELRQLDHVGIAVE